MSEQGSSGRLASLCFVHPDFDAGGRYRGLTVDARGRLGMVQESQALRQSLLLLLSTMPGERLRRPDYGCDLYRLLFSPNDETTHGLAMHYVTQAVNRFEPRVEVIEVDASHDPLQGQFMRLLLRYRILRTREEDQLEFSIDLHSANG